MIPEQLFSTEAEPVEGVSAVKALAIASSQGQRIYTIDQNNLTTALAALTFDDDAVRQEIQTQVTAGFVVTIHQNELSYAGWSGVGYTVIDPETGAGAYKISGGSDGGYFTLAAVALASLLGIVVTSSAILVSTPLLLFLGITTLLVSTLASSLGPDYNSFAGNIDATGHIAGSLIFINLLFAGGVLGAATFPIFIVWALVAFLPILI